MTSETFLALSRRQQHVMALAMLLREGLEPLHRAGHLTQSQMKTLNQAIRPVLWDAVTFLEAAPNDPVLTESFERLVLTIPDYWEVPGSDDRGDVERLAV